MPRQALGERDADGDNRSFESAKSRRQLSPRLPEAVVPSVGLLRLAACAVRFTKPGWRGATGGRMVHYDWVDYDIRIRFEAAGEVFACEARFLFMGGEVRMEPARSVRLDTARLAGFCESSSVAKLYCQSTRSVGTCAEAAQAI